MNRWLQQNKILFPLAVGITSMGCLLFCAVLWEPHPMTWKDPDLSLLCWFFCSSLSEKGSAPKYFFGMAVLLPAAASLLGAFALRRDRSSYRPLLAVSGFLLFPVGLLNLVPFFIKKR